MADRTGNEERGMENAQDRDLTRAEVVGHAGIDAGIVALQNAKPDLAPVFALLGEPAKKVLSHFIHLVNNTRAQRALYALGSGIGQAGISSDEFMTRCEGDPSLLQLSTNVVTAAQDAVFEGKVEGLARALAAALEDGSRVDEEILFTSVLKQMEEPHIRVLAHMEHAPSGYTSKQLAELDPGLEGVIDPLLGTLAGLGLIIRESPDGVRFTAPGPETASYLITGFGNHLLQRVRETRGRPRPLPDGRYTLAWVAARFVLRPVPHRPAALRIAVHRQVPSRPPADPLLGGQRGRAVTKRPGDHDQAGLPLVRVRAPLRTAPPIRPLRPQYGQHYAI